MNSRSLLRLVSDPQAAWSDAVVSTIGRGTHSVATDRWRYIRYFDGSEELYDLRQDAEEWTNLAEKSQHAALKNRLAAQIPEDRRIKRFVRWGSWKCVFPMQGEPQLFDYEAPFGISEQNDLAAAHPEVVRAIRAYLQETGTTARRLTMPEDAGS